MRLPPSSVRCTERFGGRGTAWGHSLRWGGYARSLAAASRGFIPVESGSLLFREGCAIEPSSSGSLEAGFVVAPGAPACIRRRRDKPAGPLSHLPRTQRPARATSFLESDRPLRP